MVIKMGFHYKLLAFFVLFVFDIFGDARPNIVLVMTDDQGWGQTGYYNHPVLKTPHLDAMAENGLRLDRFYSGASNCSPTRASVLTGRSNDRTGVFNHGFGLNLQEKTIAQALKEAGYHTAHFGKWHLNYIRGAGAPMVKEDPHGPGKVGFDHWLTVTNFFDLDPLMSRNGEFERFKGDSSEIIVDEALKFIKERESSEKPFFTVIWYGTPHSPFQALEKDLAHFKELDASSQAHYAELVAMDRSIGTLRKGLRDMGVAENTLIWFNSDNGGLNKLTPPSTGGLKGFKNSLNEGGLRVPCVIEWPKGIQSKVSSYPAFTGDIFPTVASIVGLPRSSMNEVIDGIDISPLFQKDLKKRKSPIPFRHDKRYALIDNDYKLLITKADAPELYNLKSDAGETTNLAQQKPELLKSMQTQLNDFLASVDRSVEGKDYPEGKVIPPNRERIFWSESDLYKPHLEIFATDPNLKKYIGKKSKSHDKVVPSQKAKKNTK